MKRILITGADSYVGTSVETYLLRYNETCGEERYRIDTISMLDETWKAYDFSAYDTVFHVAGIAHADVGKVSEETKTLYYRVNRDLALLTAQKARKEGVKQFIYMSSIIVYGESAPVGGKKHITDQTLPSPANFYGDSKLQAEVGLCELESELFHVAILRPPMIYGKGSKGNYPLLSLLAGKLPFCPDVSNERSMLYVENLAEFVRMLVDNGRGGTFYPQNGEYTKTAQMIRLIAETKGRGMPLFRLLNPFVLMASKIPGKIGGLTNKAFGNLTVDQNLSRKDFDGYQIYSLKESIQKTERL